MIFIYLFLCIPAAMHSVPAAMHSMPGAMHLVPAGMHLVPGGMHSVPAVPSMAANMEAMQEKEEEGKGT